MGNEAFHTLIPTLFSTSTAVLLLVQLASIRVLYKQQSANTYQRSNSTLSYTASAIIAKESTAKSTKKSHSNPQSNAISLFSQAVLSLAFLILWKSEALGF
jgi:hypothetical protein